MKLPNIFFLTAFPPNEQTAGQNYTRQLLNQLPENINIDLAYFNYRNHISTIKKRVNIINHEISLSIIGRIFNSLLLFIFHPLFTNRFNLPVAIRLFPKMKKADLLYFDFSQTFLYALLVPNKKKILMIHDVILQKEERRKGILGFIFSKMAYLTEKIIFSLANTTLLCFSEKDRSLIASRYGKHAEFVTFFINDLIRNIQLETVEEKSFCFFGAWNRKENSEGLQYFISHVAPFCDPTIKFYIIGPNLDSSIIEQLKSFPNFKYMGFMENPYELISRCKGLIAPLFQGAGVKVKIIESLACGTYVLGTHVALEGINCSIEKAINLCETPQDFLDAINSLCHTMTLSDKIYLHHKFIEEYEKQTSIAFITKLIGSNQ